MLYITTRSERDAFTPHRTLCTDRAPDNGLFIPMRFPKLSEEQIRSIISDSFEESVARVVNLFFSTELTQWDVGLDIGRNSARIAEINAKICFAELWHNPGNGLSYIINGLYRRVYGKTADTEPTEWFRLVVKIAVIFGVYGELCRLDIISFGVTFDFSVPADDLSYPIAALYAADMGLPIGNIVCNCVQTHSVWNMIHRGELNFTGAGDALQGGIERLLLCRLGNQCDLCCQTTQLSPEEHDKLRKGLFCVVSGSDRSYQSMSSIFVSTRRLLSPESALCIAGLGDYRAKTGESRLTLILEEDSPRMFPKEIQRAIGLSDRKIGEYLKE